MYIYDIITETFVEFYYRDLETPIVCIVIITWRESFLFQIQLKIREMYRYFDLYMCIRDLVTQTGSEAHLASCFKWAHLLFSIGHEIENSLFQMLLFSHRLLYSWSNLMIFMGNIRKVICKEQYVIEQACLY